MDKNNHNLGNEKWYVQSTNATPLLLMHALEGGVYTAWERSGQGYTHLIFHCKDDYGEGFYHVPSLKRIYEFFLEGQRKDSAFVEKLRKRSEDEADEIYSYIEEIKQADVAALGKEELLLRFREMCEKYALTCATGHLIEGFTLNADHDIKRLLEKNLGEEKKKYLPSYLTILTTPTEPSLLAQEEQELIRIAELVREDPQLQELFNTKTFERIDEYPHLRERLEEHCRNYFWIDASYAAAPIADMHYFLGKIQQILEEDRHEIDEDTTSREKKDDIIRELGISGRLKMLLEMSNTIATWQDERKKHMLAGACYVDLLACEVARRYGIEHNLIRYLTTQDISPEKMERLDEAELLTRREGCMMIYTREERTLLTDKECERIYRNLEQDHEQHEEIRGTCASVGKAVGRVRICKSQSAIESFREGEILVASGTRPEFVPAMKKAAAIVTDEGGITSHAAIVSRELRKPCVIGTRNATKTLKDGDLVEVKADHGIVILMER